jgi:hypothetical protein
MITVPPGVGQFADTGTAAVVVGAGAAVVVGAASVSPAVVVVAAVVVGDSTLSLHADATRANTNSNNRILFVT